MNIYNVYFRWSNFKSIPKSVAVRAESKEQAEQVVHEELIKLGKANNCGEPIIKAIKCHRSSKMSSKSERILSRTDTVFCQ